MVPQSDQEHGAAERHQGQDGRERGDQAAAQRQRQQDAPEAELARQKLKALTRRKTYSSLDTQFGVLTVEDASKEPAARRPNRNGNSALRKIEWFEKKPLKLFDNVRRL